MPTLPPAEIRKDGGMHEGLHGRFLPRIGEDEAGEFPAVQTAVTVPEAGSEQRLHPVHQGRIAVVQGFGLGIGVVYGNAPGLETGRDGGLAAPHSTGEDDRLHGISRFRCSRTRPAPPGSRARPSAVPSRGPRSGRTGRRRSRRSRCTVRRIRTDCGPPGRYSAG